MRNDFGVFILSHGRPDKVHTYKTIRETGYTGKIWIVVDNEDKTIDQYRKIYGDQIVVFDKAAVAKWTDDGDNWGHRRSVLYARNAAWDVAAQVGVRLFIVFDDDYTSFWLRYDEKLEYASIQIRSHMDDVLEAMLEFYEKTPVLSFAMSQGGDHIGGGGTEDNPGGQATPGLRRKAMNSFICSVDRRFDFMARMNDDTTTYLVRTLRGELFFTLLHTMLVQLPTQQNAGGLTELYLDHGTYVKTFYSVMFAPSCVKIGEMGEEHARIHHEINWHRTAPKILRESHKKNLFE